MTVRCFCSNPVVIKICNTGKYVSFLEGDFINYSYLLYYFATVFVVLLWFMYLISNVRNSWISKFGTNIAVLFKLEMFSSAFIGGEFYSFIEHVAVESQHFRSETALTL